MFKRIEHVGLSTKKYQRLIDFYSNIIGFKVLYDGSFKGDSYGSIMALDMPEGRVALLDLDGTQLEVFEFRYPKAPNLTRNRPVNHQGITHICFSVENINHEYQRLMAAGMSFHCAPKIFPGEGKATYGRDPDGNVIELFEPIFSDSE